MIRSVKNSEQHLKKNNSKKSEDKIIGMECQRMILLEISRRQRSCSTKKRSGLEEANRELNIDDESGDESERE